MESAYYKVLHLSSESLVVSHQVHGNNISRRIQKKESIILSIATSQTIHRQTVITSRWSPSEESYLFKSNYV